MSDGRCVLGIGSGWRPREHVDHGIAFGSSVGERLSWLDESLELIRAVLRGDDADSPAGSHYTFVGASQRPMPVRGPGRLPILVGGGGEQRTLRIVAKHADAWHHPGSVAELSHKRDILWRHCDELGRDQRSIECAFGPRVMIRDDPGQARRLLDARLMASGEVPSADPDAAWCGPPEEIAARWKPYLSAGFSHLIAGMVGPYDEETVERLIEVREMMGGAPPNSETLGRESVIDV